MGNDNGERRKKEKKKGSTERKGKTKPPETWARKGDTAAVTGATQTQGERRE